MRYRWDTFPALGPGRARHRTNLYEKWPLGAISQQAGQGGPASVRIYKKTCFRRAFSSRWPREGPPPYKSIPKLASGAHFPTGRPGRARQRTNLYQNWPPEGVSQQVAQGSPATVQIYTKSGLLGTMPLFHRSRTLLPLKNGMCLSWGGRLNP